MTFGHITSMRTRPALRDDVIAILLSGVDGLRAAGCLAYLIGVDEHDPDLIWVTEHWQSKDDHAASLQLPEAKEAIGQALSMLTGEFTSQDFTVVGGLGA